MRYLAFLRAINTGNRRVTNDRLRAAFEGLGLGLEGVGVYQASGNVIFDAPSVAGLTAKIEKGLSAALGFEVPVYLRSCTELRRVVSAEPFSADELAATTGNVQIMFLTGQPSAAGAKALANLTTEEDQLVLIGKEVHWLPRVGVGTSPLSQRVVVAAVGPTTIRGLSAVGRMVDKFCS